jgi:iron(II)-dependent oxidoreductase
MAEGRRLYKAGKLTEAREEVKKALAYRGTKEARSLLNLITDNINIPEGMVYVPAGPCIIGSTKILFPWEGPRHEREVPAYYMDVHLVTNRKYMEFVKAAGHRAPSHWKDGRIPAGKEEHPVTHVNLSDAKAYAEWAGKKLPTEAEWEKTARGKKGLVYPWGRVYKSGMINDSVAGIGGTTPVGSFPQGISPFWCHDMAGNVLEWTSTKWHLYAGSKDSPMEGSENKYVVKGGAFDGDRLHVRSACRWAVDPNKPDDHLGFRCAKDVKR